jgi:hypothetical protein
MPPFPFLEQPGSGGIPFQSTCQPSPGYLVTSPSSASIRIARCTVSRATPCSSASKPMLSSVPGGSLPSAIRAARSAWMRTYRRGSSATR